MTVVEDRVSKNSPGIQNNATDSIAERRSLRCDRHTRNDSAAVCCNRVVLKTSEAAPTVIDPIAAVVHDPHVFDDQEQAVRGIDADALEAADRSILHRHPVAQPAYPIARVVDSASRSAGHPKAVEINGDVCGSDQDAVEIRTGRQVAGELVAAGSGERHGISRRIPGRDVPGHRLAVGYENLPVGRLGGRGGDCCP